MKTAKDITEDFGTLYHPKCALVFYGAKTDNEMYVEHFDMDKNGSPVNPHPLTVGEAEALAQSLMTGEQKDTAFLQSGGILPTEILHINPSKDKGAVLWYSKAQKRKLFFAESLGIPSGLGHVPAMLYHATKTSLRVFALAGNRRPSENTPLYSAPFFNIYEDGKVCMGSVNVEIKKSASVEEFTDAWEDYFFNSYFSHLMGKKSPVKGNCVSLWKELIGADKHFPKEVLKMNNKTLKSLL